MTNESLRERALQLRLHGLVERWGEVEADPGLSRTVARLIDWEEETRSESRRKRLLKSSRLRAFESLSTFDWVWPKRIRRDDIEELFSLAFLKERTDVVFLGPSGVGKTMLAKNLVHEAARRGEPAVFVEAAEMLGELVSEQSRTGVEKALKRYAKPKLLAIDEVGYLSYDTRHADLLLRVVQSRHRQASTVVTTNRPFKEWREMFPNAASVVALVDRLTENCEVIQIEGDSYRTKRAQERKSRKESGRGK